MSGLVPRRAAAVTAAVVGSVVAIGILAPRGHDVDKTHAAVPSIAVADHPTRAQTRPNAALVTRDPEVLPHGSARDRRRVAAAARSFTRAFARYEVGNLSRPVVLGLRRFGHPELVDALLRRPPRPVAAPMPCRAHLTGVSGIRVRGDAAWIVLDLRRCRKPSGLALELVRAPGRFVIVKAA